MGCQGVGSQVQAFSNGDKVSIATEMGSRANAGIKVAWSAGLQHWLRAHNVPRTEMPRQPTEVLHRLCKWEDCCCGLTSDNRVRVLQPVLRLEPVHKPPTP